jgi:thiol-disulfide isomerase/thioredoxin
VNEDNQKLKTALQVPEKKMQAYMSEWRSKHPGVKKMDDNDMADYKARLKAYNEEKNQVYLDFIKENPNSFISFDAIKYLAGPVPDYSKIAPLFNSLSSDVQNTIAGKEYAKLLKGVKATAIGEMALEFTQNDPDGKPVKLSGFKGKYVLVDFWASWCSPCRAENPNVVKAYNKYHEKGLEIISVSLDDIKGKDAWLAAIKKDGLIWKHVSDLKGQKNEVAVLYGIKAIPQNVLLDKTGKIIGKNLRGEALNKKLEEIFN